MWYFQVDLKVTLAGTPNLAREPADSWHLHLGALLGDCLGSPWGYRASPWGFLTNSRGQSSAVASGNRAKPFRDYGQFLGPLLYDSLGTSCKILERFWPILGSNLGRNRARSSRGIGQFLGAILGDCLRKLLGKSCKVSGGNRATPEGILGLVSGAVVGCRAIPKELLASMLRQCKVCLGSWRFLDALLGDCFGKSCKVLERYWRCLEAISGYCLWKSLEKSCKVFGAAVRRPDCWAARPPAGHLPGCPAAWLARYWLIPGGAFLGDCLGNP